MKKRVWIGLFILAVLINGLAWISRNFCDFYIRTVFPFLSAPLSRFASFFPFSLGEWMLVSLGVFLIALLGVAAVFLIGKRAWAKKLLCRLGRAFAWIFLLFFWIMTCNCLIAYHTSPFADLYLQESGRFHTKEELAVLRDFMVENANELAGRMLRDEKGEVIYEQDMTQTAIAAMQRTGDFCPLLKGEYPPAKGLYFSHLFSQMDMMGYFFPFSMEANYNRDMYLVNRPATVCHEYSHLKGFLREDEANLIGYLACVNSEDPFFRYSGYLSVLGYVESAFLDSIQRDAAVYRQHPAISAQVCADAVFLTDEAWEKVEKTAALPTESTAKASRAVTSAALKMNGVKEGTESYRGVVALLLDYYFAGIK